MHVFVIHKGKLAKLLQKQSIKFYTGKYKIVRIHVERIMGVLKQKFTFYETLYQYQIIDKIVCVCVVH